MTAPTMPLLVFEGNDLSTFDTIETACAQLEAIDVQNGEFESYDGEGYRVVLETSGYAVVGASRVEEQAPEVDDLGDRLRAYLSAVGDPSPTAVPATDLDALIRAAATWSR